MTRLRPFFQYFGAKYRLAPKYPYPVHNTIVEWYAGSAQYACLHHGHEVVLIEKYAPVAAIWEWLISAALSDIDRLPTIIDRDLKSYGLAPGPEALIGFWLTSASASPRRSMSARCRQSLPGGSHAGQAIAWGHRVKQRIKDQLPAIRHWTVLHGDVTDIDPGLISATHFVDPPYQVAGKNYPEHALDYGQIADRCRQAEGQVIVCEAAGANWLPFEPLGRVKASSRGGARHSHEMVWVK